MKRNRYSRALKHLKSTELDEKLQRLNEGPTNSIGGVYALNPPGFRVGIPDPPKVYYPDADGNWPAGIPGTPGELSYTRPEGYWSGGSDWDQQIATDFTQNYLLQDPTGKSTKGLIADDGTVLAKLPPGGQSFILGPIVDGFVPNHTSDAYTNIGYIQKDTRQFVLLARIQGQWKSNLNGNYPVWDGTSGKLTIYNANFTLAMAEWIRDEILANKYTSNVPYFYSGGVPQVPQSAADCPNCPPGMYGGKGVGGAPFGKGGNPNIGTKQGNPTKGGPDPNLVPGSANPNIAQLSDKQERKELQMLLKGLIRGDYGTGPNIDQQIKNIEIKLYGIPIKGADAGAKSGDDLIAGGPTLYGPNGPSLKPDGTSGFPKPGEMNKGNNGQWYEYVPGSGWIGIPSLKLASYQPQGQVLTETRQRIFREIKQPYKLPEQPKQKYKMNFKGKFTSQNTPDVTASKKSDDMVKAQNAAGQSWRTNDKYWKGYETTERMNIIYDNVGHGSQYWDMIINENQRRKGWRDREVQENLNIIAHEKAMIQENPQYQSPFQIEIEEQETMRYDNDPLFKKVKNKLKTEIDYPDKPSKLGYPNDPPPEQVDGWHPNYGERDSYYNSLDPHSANAMPPTGNPNIDAKVKKAKRIKALIKKK